MLQDEDDERERSNEVTILEDEQSMRRVLCGRQWPVKLVALGKRVGTFIGTEGERASLGPVWLPFSGKFDFGNWHFSRWDTVPGSKSGVARFRRRHPFEVLHR